MIAKINLEGKEHLAIVFNETFSYEDIVNFRKAINEYMRNAEAQLDVCDNGAPTHLENYYLHALISEMEFTENQVNEMLKSYFADSAAGKKAKTAERKTCEVYI